MDLGSWPLVDKLAAAYVTLVMGMIAGAIGPSTLPSVITIYHSANIGVAIGDCYHFNVGFEVIGNPGPFLDAC